MANDTPVELFGGFSSTISNASAHAIVGYGHVSNVLTAIGDVIWVRTVMDIMIIVMYM